MLIWISRFTRYDIPCMISRACRGILVTTIQLYQYWSPGLGTHNVCRFPHQSCSHFSIAALQQKGLFKGIGLTILRLLACQPWIRVPWERQIHTIDILPQKPSQ